MYRPITMYQIICDRCGKVFEGSDTLPVLFADKCSSIDLAYHSDWENIKGRHYCPECYEVSIVNGAYTVKVKD